MKTIEPATNTADRKFKFKLNPVKHAFCALAIGTALSVLAQVDDRRPPEGQRPPPANGGPPQGGPGFDGPPPFGPGNFGPGGPGRGGFGGPGLQQETKLVKQFDKDGDKRLNAVERKAAREFMQNEIAAGRGRRGPLCVRTGGVP